MTPDGRRRERRRHRGRERTLTRQEEWKGTERRNLTQRPASGLGGAGGASTGVAGTDREDSRC